MENVYLNSRAIKQCFKCSEDVETLKNVLRNTEMEIHEIGSCESPFDENEYTKGKYMYKLSVRIEKDGEFHTFPFYASINDCEILTGRSIKKTWNEKKFFYNVFTMEKYTKNLDKLNIPYKKHKNEWVVSNHKEYYEGKELAKKKKEVRDGFLYSILCCIRSDYYCPDTFEEFCSEFGYDTDSRKAFDIFGKLNINSSGLQCLFDNKEIESLPW